MNQLDAEVLKKHGTESAYHLGIFDSYSQGRVTFRQPFRNVVAIEVVESHLPYTDYTIDNFRRTLSVNSNSVNLDVGNYTIDELIVELNAKLPDGLTASVSPRTKIITFDGDTDNFTLKVSKDMGKVLGLREGTFQSENHILVAHHPYNLQPDTVVRLMCDEVDNSVTKGRPGSNVIGLTEQLLRHNLVREDVHIPMRRDFHPITSLGQLTIRFIQEHGGTSLGQLRSGNYSDDTSNIRISSDTRDLYDFKGQDWYLKLVIHSIDIEDGKHAQNSIVRAPVSRPNMLPFASNHEW